MSRKMTENVWNKSPGKYPIMNTGRNTCFAGHYRVGLPDFLNRLFYAEKRVVEPVILNGQFISTFLKLI
jgi:hypothetical protein